MSLDPDKLRFILLAVVAMIFSGSVHEWAHAFSASKLGDDTAARAGRLTLNPISHIDPVGTLIMPMVGAWYGFIFGWMKPVPFSPIRFTRKLTMSTSTLIVAAAGPFSNLVLAFVCGGLLKLITIIGGIEIFAENEIAHMIGALLFVGIWLNAILALFNLLPIYPLDGSKILEGILPRKYHRHLEFIQQNSMIFMVLIFLVGARFLQIPMIELSSLVLKLYRLGPELTPFSGYFG